MSKRFDGLVTKDGAEVNNGEIVYYCRSDGKRNGKRDEPIMRRAYHTQSLKSDYAYFSKFILCQKYIDQFNEPIYKTEDGVMVQHSDTVWFCPKYKDEYINIAVPVETYACGAFRSDKYVAFSTKELCQKYIDMLREEKDKEEKTFEKEMLSNEIKDSVEKWKKCVSDYENEASKDIKNEISEQDDTKIKCVIAGKEQKPGLHNILLDFSKHYDIPLNSVLEFIICQKSH